MLTCEKLITKDYPKIYLNSRGDQAIEALKAFQVDHAPVVESPDSNKFVGEISSYGLMSKMQMSSLDASNFKIEEVVDAKAPIVGSETPVKDALLAMVENGTGRINVVDKMNNLVGVISSYDLVDSPELKFSWTRLFESADSSLFESNFERNRESYEKKAEIELANIMSMLDIMQLKSRVAAHEGDVNIIKAAIFDEINVVRKDLENSFKAMREATNSQWYKMRDEYEVNKHKLNEKLFYLKEPIEQLVARNRPRVSSSGPIRSTK